MPSRRNVQRQCGALASRLPGQVEYLSYADRPAFTLIELMIVVAIAVVLIAVALPTIKYSLEDMKLREGARQFNAFFASAKAHAASTGLPAGVWLQVEQVGDPNALPVNRFYQCSQLYLAEVPAPYSGDVLNARCNVTGSNVPFLLNFTPAAASLNNLVADGEQFYIRFDFKGHYFLARRNGSNYEIIDTSFYPPKSNGTAGYAFQIYRRPQRVGQPLELPRGIVIDMGYSGLGPGGLDSQGRLTGNEFHLSAQAAQTAQRGILVMFSPAGGVATVWPWVDPSTFNVSEDSGSSRIHFLVGRTEHVEYPWNSNWRVSNIADGGNLWVSVNRRTGSVATVENTPNPNLPMATPTPTPAQQRDFLNYAREFSTKGDVKGGQ